MPRKVLSLRLSDPDAERVRRSTQDAIEELQGGLMAGAVVVPDVSLASGVTTVVAHGLGRRPLFVLPTPPRGATSTGRIEEIRDGNADRTKAVQLKATGWGSTIVVDVVCA